MARIEHTVEINRPPAEVFTYLVDPDKVPSWQASIVELRKDDAAPTTVGSTLSEVRTVMGRRIESRLEVTAYEQDRRFDLRTKAGPVPFEVRHTLTPAGAGTRLDIVGETEGGGVLGGMAGGLFVRQAKTQLQGDFARLKEMLER